MTKERTMVEKDGEKCRKLKNSSGYVLEDCKLFERSFDCACELPNIISLHLKKLIGWLFIWKQEKSASRLVQEIFQLPDFSAKRLKSEGPNRRKVAVFGPCDVCIDSLLRFLWIIFHPTTAYCRLKTSRPNSEWFEFVRLIAVTCFRRHTCTDGEIWFREILQRPVPWCIQTLKFLLVFIKLDLVTFLQSMEVIQIFPSGPLAVEPVVLVWHLDIERAPIPALPRAERIVQTWDQRLNSALVCWLNVQVSTIQQ